MHELLRIYVLLHGPRTFHSSVMLTILEANMARLHYYKSMTNAISNHVKLINSVCITNATIEN
jgi:hypothetical protein